MADFRGFGPRLVSAVALAAIALTAVHFGHPWFTFLIVAAGLLMAREWPELCLAGAGTRPLWRPVPPLKAVVFVVAVVTALALAAFGWHLWAVAASFAGAVLTHLLAHDMAGTGRRMFALGVPYIAVPATALIYLGRDPVLGAATIYWVFAVVWATDVGGYLVGRTVGGRKLAPEISPGKTWSGFIGATLLAALVAGLFGLVAGEGRPLFLAGAGLMVSLAAQMGDLAESAVKRHFAVKDSSSIIPGHGGLFDRVDGLVAGATLVAGAAVAAGNTGFLWR